MSPRLEPGLDAFARKAWSEAHRELTAARPEDLGAAGLERLAVAAYMIGEDDESATAWEAAHRLHAETGEEAEAARCSFWLAMCLMMRGQAAQAGGWLSRTEAIVSSTDRDCAAEGYLMIPGLLHALDEGDAAGAAGLAVRATEIGNRLNDADLGAFGALGHGQALIAMGETASGTAKLDEVMVSVTAGEVGPITSGIVYCAVILECMQLYDFSRATEWTEALSAWCDAQPDLVPYRGQCLVHRSQLLQASGDWPAAITTVESACERLTDPPHPALGLAYYQEAELNRLLGRFDEAESEYRRANRNGYTPMPGLALLELVRGDGDAASAAIGRALGETVNLLDRTPLLAAAVDIFRAVGNIDRARTAADELATIAEASTSEVLKAMAAQAEGAVLLGEGDASAALTRLRAAAAAWRQLHMPYETARTTVLLGLSCAALGDHSSALLEFDAARDAFAQLGARPDLERLQTLAESLAAATATDEGQVLSNREREVLAHVAEGKTNREIAAELLISQHTVGRHLENIFAKLGVSSRAAATAHAFEHDLL